MDEYKEIKASRLSTKEIQEVSYSILKYFVEICEKNKLKYILGGGTLLGAIRHKGFIPWDDDIDINMPRPDYEKLIEILRNSKEELEKLNLEASSYELENKSFYTFLKIHDKKTIVFSDKLFKQDGYGVWIDIFPCDGVPKGSFWQKLHFKKYRLLELMHIASITKFGIKRRNQFLTRCQWLMFPIDMILKLIGYQPFSLLLEKTAKKYRFEDCDEVAVMCGRAGIKEIMPKKDYFEIVPVKFEDMICNAPQNYDYYLSSLYGDYMTLPPEDKREIHSGEVYWKKEIIKGE